MLDDPSEHEYQVFRAYRLGDHHCAHDQERLGLDDLMQATSSDDSLRAAWETREEMLARQLAAERQALRALKGKS
jgi:hypothetical protein